MHCILCKKEMKALFPDVPEQISVVEGVYFSGSGGFGSQFDMSPRFVILLCDDCLKEEIDKQNVLKENRKSTVTYTYETATNDFDVPL